MSRKLIEEEAQNHDWTADTGPTLKMIGEVILAQWHDANGVFLSSEERKERGKRPQAEVMQSDIQVRIGNRLITLKPADEGKAMISIPVGLSDKATPATIPREWLVGVFIDSMIEAFEGDATVVRYLANGVNAAINNAMEVSDDGRMKINQKKLPEFNNPVEVAEMLESFKRTFVSKSKPSTKANFTMVVQELEPIEEAPQEVEVVEHTPSQADLVMQLADNLASHSTPQEEQEVGEDSHSYTEPVHASEEAESPTPPANDAEEVVAVAADPTPPVVDEDTDDSSDGTGGETISFDPETNIEVVDMGDGFVEIDHTPPVDENPHNFKKNPTEWIKHDLITSTQYSAPKLFFSIEEVAERAGCHVQTIKRALDKFEAEAAYVHMQNISTFTDEQLQEGLPGWVQLDVVIDDEYELIITCERSATGRYARGRPITFSVQGKATEAVADSDFDSIPVEALEDAPSVLETVIVDAPREEVEAEWEELMKDSEPYEFPALPEVIDTPVAAIEGATGRCVVSAEPGKFIANTAIGERWFASEKHWAEYTGNPVMPEGHYGLQAQHDEEVKIQLEAQEESRLRAENQFNLQNAMGF